MARLTEEMLEQNKKRILGIAVRAFSRHGFSGVTIRDIAKQTRLPLGSHYNYFADKEALFKAAVHAVETRFFDDGNPVIDYFKSSTFPDDIPVLADAIRRSVEDHPDYFKLMYVDVIEFEGRHIRETFSNLDAKFRKVLTQHFTETGLLGDGTDPAFALVFVYLSLYQYFVISKLFGAQNVFGRKNDKAVVESMTHLLLNGIARPKLPQ